MSPLKVIFDLIFMSGNMTYAFNIVFFTEWFETAGVSFTLFNVLFNPATFTLVFGLVVAKKVVPLL
jgi:hypothetical protein